MGFNGFTKGSANILVAFLSSTYHSSFIARRFVLALVQQASSASFVLQVRQFFAEFALQKTRR
ncbi:MAG: hypothetical protein ACI9HK_004071 [Pirellulaceae bacterium]